MKFIDKINSRYASIGNSCVQEEIDRSWNNEISRHVALRYDASCESLKKLKKILIEQQQFLCCYCMRRLSSETESCSSDNVTLEHIIPHKITQDEWEGKGQIKGQKESFLKFDCLGPKYITICFKAEMQCPNVKISGLPHPHFISYNNLVASCNGAVLQDLSKTSKVEPSHCCNLKRGNAFVAPIYLDVNLVKEIEYTKDGSIFFPDEMENKGLDTILNLNDIALKMARKFWSLVASSPYSDQDVYSAINDKKLRQDILDDVAPISWNFLVENDSAWRWISEYNWFFEYYKK